MFRWYVINTYSGHENKVKQNLEHRVHTMSQERNVRQVVVPTEQVSEMKDGQKIQTEKRTMPGYVLVNMEMTDDSWGLVKNTPGVTGFVGSRNKPIPLSKVEVDRLLHRETAERPAHPRPVLDRRVRQGDLRARSPTSPARSPRSTRTPPSSRCWSRSSAARPRSRSTTTR